MAWHGGFMVLGTFPGSVIENISNLKIYSLILFEIQEHIKGRKLITLASRPDHPLQPLLIVKIYPQKLDIRLIFFGPV